MIFIKEVWQGFKLTTYQLLNALMSFDPTQHSPTIIPSEYSDSDGIIVGPVELGQNSLERLRADK